MTTRRAFIRGVTATTIVASQVNVRAFAVPVLISPRRTIVDGRYPESQAFAGESQRRGSAVHLTNGDVTRLWYDELHVQWLRTPMAIAGLTAHGPLFCLERWAWDHGLRVVMRIDHHRLAGGGTTHQVAVAGSPEGLRARLLAAGDDYPLAAARAAHQCVQGSFQVCSPSGVACGPHDPEPLISWVIAPITRE